VPPDVAMIPADERAGLLETAHLLRSPRKAQRLLTALGRAARGTLKRTPVSQLRGEMGLGPSRDAIFHPEFRKDLRFGVDPDRNTAWRVVELVDTG